jgi:FlaA1/EpsC-like NDP-sugar epimerase
MMFPFKQFFLKHSCIIIPSWLILLKDVLIVLFSFSFAYTLRYNFQLKDDSLLAMYFQLRLIGMYALVVFFLLGLHKGLIRHTGLRDAVLIVKAVFLITCAMLISNILVNYNLVPAIFRVPHSIVILFFALASTLIVLIRGSVRLFYNWLHAGGKLTRVLIYGAGTAGMITKNVLHADKSRNTEVFAFIDDNPAITGKTIEGVMVYPTSVLKREFIDHYGIAEIVFCIHNIEKEQKNELIERLLLQTQLKVKEIPPVDAWINGELSVKQISSVKITDLLQRSEIKLPNEHLHQQLERKRVMVTGAAGSIGSEIVRQLLGLGPALVIMVDQDETAMFHLENEMREKAAAYTKHNGNRPPELEFIIGNVGDHHLMSMVFAATRPQIIYHAAAYKHVPMMERNPCEAVRVNIFGTRNMADLALQFRSERFVMVSTDKAVNPTNVMGATKRAAEIYIQSLNNHLHAGLPSKGTTEMHTEFITTRFGNVLGSNGSVIPLFEKQIARGGPVTVTHPDITRYFMTIPEACRLVLEAGTIGNGGEILMFDMGKPIRIADLAFNMIRLSGLEPDVDIPIVYTGLRPGEKLFEELLYDKEKGMPTHHPKISIACIKPYPLSVVTDHLNMLNHITANGSTDPIGGTESLHEQPDHKMQLIAELKAMIPEYKSNNSVYQKLDVLV